MSEPRNIEDLLGEIAKLKLELMELKLAWACSDSTVMEVLAKARRGRGVTTPTTISMGGCGTGPPVPGTGYEAGKAINSPLCSALCSPLCSALCSAYDKRGVMIDQIIPMFKVVKINFGPDGDTETLEQEHISHEAACDLCGGLNYTHANTDGVLYQVRRQGLLVVPQVKPWTAPEPIPFKNDGSGA